MGLYQVPQTAGDPSKNAVQVQQAMAQLEAQNLQNDIRAQQNEAMEIELGRAREVLDLEIQGMEADLAGQRERTLYSQARRGALQYKQQQDASRIESSFLRAQRLTSPQPSEGAGEDTPPAIEDPRILGLIEAAQMTQHPDDIERMNEALDEYEVEVEKQVAWQQVYDDAQTQIGEIITKAGGPTALAEKFDPEMDPDLANDYFRLRSKLNSPETKAKEMPALLGQLEMMVSGNIQAALAAQSKAQEADRILREPPPQQGSVPVRRKGPAGGQPELTMDQRRADLSSQIDQSGFYSGAEAQGVLDGLGGEFGPVGTASPSTSPNEAFGTRKTRQQVVSEQIRDKTIEPKTVSEVPKAKKRAMVKQAKSLVDQYGDDPERLIIELSAAGIRLDDELKRTLRAYASTPKRGPEGKSRGRYEIGPGGRQTED